MAFLLTKAVTEPYDQNVTDSSGGAVILKLAQADNAAAQRRLVGLPTFTFEATTTGTETIVIGNSGATLAALGVTFPAGFIRNIRVRAYSRTVAADGGLSERLFSFRGNAAIGSVTLATDGTVLSTAITALALPSALPYAGANVGIPQAGVDATQGPFITVFSAAVGAVATATAVNARHRVEIYVEPLVSVAPF